MPGRPGLVAAGALAAAEELVEQSQHGQGLGSRDRVVDGLRVAPGAHQTVAAQARQMLRQS